MQQLTITTKLELTDWQAFSAAHATRVRQRTSVGLPRWWAVAITFCLMVVWVLLSASFSTDSFGLALSFLLGMVAMGALIKMVQSLMQQRLIPAANGGFLGPCKFEFDAQGIRISKVGSATHCAWTRVLEITHTATHLFLWTDHFSALVIPLRDLSADETLDSVLTLLRQWGVSESTTAIAMPASHSWWNVSYHLLTLRRGVASGLGSPQVVNTLLAVGTLLVWLIFDRIRAGHEAELYLYNIAVLALMWVGLLGMAMVTVRVASPPLQFTTALLLILSVLPVALVLYIAMTYMPPTWQIRGLSVLLLYIAVYFWRGLYTLTSRHQPRVLMFYAALGMVAFTLNQQVQWSASLWYSPEPTEIDAQGATWHNSEKLLFEQRARIDQALHNLAPRDATRPTVFFVGFAGVAEQKVFAGEINLAARVVAERFHSPNHSVLLLNDRRDVHTQPLATLSGLRYVLQQMATKMDVEHDVLFLALSSHGSEAPYLVVSNGALPLQQLSDVALAAALDEAKIKWRVIVISACHAGAFIKSLENPNTIVITAAASDKRSFGCSNERELTYFGEAFYRDALPHATSLRNAFEQAQRAIAMREQVEKQIPSEPQAFFGADIEKYWLTAPVVQ